MRPVQYFSAEYLEHAKKLSPSQVARFLEDFRLMHRKPSKSKLISIKIPEDLLDAFKRRCNLDGVPYQRKIKELMKNWL